MKHSRTIILTTLLLVLLDQGTKLLVSSLVEVNEAVLAVAGRVHIHPQINDEVTRKLLPLSEATGIPVLVWSLGRTLLLSLAFVAMLLFLYWANKFVFWDAQDRPRPLLSQPVVCLWTAGLLCSCFIDQLLWGGSLDFICVATTRTIVCEQCHLPHEVPWHRLIFDLKDVYIWLALLLLWIRIIAWLIALLKYDKANGEALKQKFRHPIQNIKQMREKSQQPMEAFNETEEGKPGDK